MVILTFGQIKNAILFCLKQYAKFRADILKTNFQGFLSLKILGLLPTYFIQTETISVVHYIWPLQ